MTTSSTSDDKHRIHMRIHGVGLGASVEPICDGEVPSGKNLAEPEFVDVGDDFVVGEMYNFKTGNWDKLTHGSKDKRYMCFMDVVFDKKTGLTFNNHDMSIEEWEKIHD